MIGAIGTVGKVRRSRGASIYGALHRLGGNARPWYSRLYKSYVFLTAFVSGISGWSGLSGLSGRCRRSRGASMYGKCVLSITRVCMSFSVQRTGWPVFLPARRAGYGFMKQIVIPRLCTFPLYNGCRISGSTFPITPRCPRPPTTPIQKFFININLKMSAPIISGAHLHESRITNNESRKSQLTQILRTKDVSIKSLIHYPPQIPSDAC